MKRSTQLAELKTQVKHHTLHKVTVRGALGREMVVNRTKKSLRITWVKTTHRPIHFPAPSLKLRPFPDLRQVSLKIAGKCSQSVLPEYILLFKPDGKITARSRR